MARSPVWPLAATSLLTSLVLPAAGFAPILRPVHPLSRILPSRMLSSRTATIPIGRCSPGARRMMGGRAAIVTPAAWSRPRSHCSMVAPGLGQDLSELFDLYEAPQPSISEFRGEPKAKGVNKARKMVHKDGDWHRAVHIWIYNSQGQLILQKRAEGKDTFPGRWDVSVGGHVTSGDTVMETAHKEVEEELGIKINLSDLEKLGVIATTAKGSSPVGGPFTCNEYKDLFLLKFDGDISGTRVAHT